MSVKLKINGEVLDDFNLTIRNSLSAGDVSVTSLDVSGRDSLVYKGTDMRPVESTLEIEFDNKKKMMSTHLLYEHLIDVLKIGQEEVLEIGFDNYKFFRRGVFTGPINMPLDKMWGTSVTFEVGVWYKDAYWYSDEEYSEDFDEDGKLGVNYKGIDEGGVFKFEALKDSSYLSLMDYSDGRFFKIGKSVPSSTATRYEVMFKGGGLDGWTSEDWNGHLTEGVGTVDYDGEFYIPTQYSGGSERTALLTRDLGGNASDFESTAMFRTRDLSPDKEGQQIVVLRNGEGSEEFFYGVEYKENNNEESLDNKVRLIFGVRLKDDRVVNTEMPFERLLDFSLDDFGRDFNNSDVFIKIKREGDKITLKHWRYDLRDGVLIPGRDKVLNDREGKYRGDSIRHLSMVFGKSREYSELDIGISNLSFRRTIVGPASGDYFIKTGDVIEINNQKVGGFVTINNEPIAQRKDISSDYLKVKKGFNDFRVFPSDAFDGSLEFRGKKL